MSPHTYLDDVLVHSACAKDHAQHLQEVFRRLREAGLILRGRKCQLGRSKVVYLGHMFSKTGMAPDHRKVSAVVDWPALSDLRNFLGSVSYYHHYIHQFAEMTAPLLHLMQIEECAFYIHGMIAVKWPLIP